MNIQGNLHLYHFRRFVITTCEKYVSSETNTRCTCCTLIAVSNPHLPLQPLDNRRSCDTQFDTAWTWPNFSFYLFRCYSCAAELIADLPRHIVHSLMCFMYTLYIRNINRHMSDKLKADLLYVHVFRLSWLALISLQGIC